jgi:hypothetical protein
LVASTAGTDGLDNHVDWKGEQTQMGDYIKKNGKGCFETQRGEYAEI